MDSIEQRRQDGIEPEDLSDLAVVEDNGQADSGEEVKVRRDGVGDQVASILGRPRVNVDQWKAARALLQVGQIEDALRAYKGLGIKPKSDSILKCGDSLSVDFFRRFDSNSPMSEKVSALHQIIAAYKYVSEFTTQKLRELAIELFQHDMPELVMLVDAAFQRGRSRKEDPGNIFDDEAYPWMTDRMDRD